jgi:hypothetical protein
LRPAAFVGEVSCLICFIISRCSFVSITVIGILSAPISIGQSLEPIATAIWVFQMGLSDEWHRNEEFRSEARINEYYSNSKSFVVAKTQLGKSFQPSLTWSFGVQPGVRDVH